MTRPSNEYGQVFTGITTVDVTWDELFAAVGADLLDEASQNTLRTGVSTWLTAQFGGQLRQIVRDKLEGEGETVRGFSRTQVHLSDSDFGTLVIQLRALGLITRSSVAGACCGGVARAKPVAPPLRT